MNETIQNRSEIVFLYDIKDANPNGDPLDENKPRIDEETDINIVTDVRLKRTVRDYLYDYKDRFEELENQDIFVREIEYEPGAIQDAKMRARDFVECSDNGENTEIINNFINGEKIKKTDIEIIKKNIRDNLTKDCIDVRLFGATVPLEFTKDEIEGSSNNSIKSTMTFIGPVQFRFGRSLHKVDMKFVKGTGAFASRAGKQQKTFRQEYILPYSLIGFYGVINENAAKKTGLTESDINLFMDGLWNGTKNLLTRSKMGQVPRLLLRIIYTENNFHIGDLNGKIELVIKDKDMEEKEIRNVSDFYLDVSKLIKSLKNNVNMIESIELKADADLEFVNKELQLIQLKETLENAGLNVNEFKDPFDNKTAENKEELVVSE